MQQTEPTPDQPPAAIKPEWIRIKYAIQVYSIGRSKLYELISEGKIKSVSLRKRGQTRGTRLISNDSLSDYIESQIEPPPAPSPSQESQPSSE